MSVYDPISLGPVRLVPGAIHADCLGINFAVIESRLQEHGLKDGIWVQDGQVMIPVKIWEDMQAAAFGPVPTPDPPRARPLPLPDDEPPDEEPGFDGLVLPMDDDKVPGR